MTKEVNIKYDQRSKYKVPNEIKTSNSLNIFKHKIKTWLPDCPCKTCRKSWFRLAQ